MALPLFKYQEDGAAFLAGKTRAGLFDEMGVGKSAQAVRACDLLKLKRGIVICPAAVRGVWIGEYGKFGIMPRKLMQCQNIHDFYAWLRGRFDVLIISFDLAAKWAHLIDQNCEIMEFVIIDEGHYLKNSEAKRTKAILGDFADMKPEAIGGIVKWAVHAWILTGTPMANDPMDIYTFLRFVEAMPLKENVFKARYFKTFKRTYNERNEPRPDIVAELKHLIQNNSIRRTQKDVGLQLPPIFLTDITLDGDTSAIIELLQQHPGLDRAIVDALRTGGLSFLDAQHIATLRRLVGEAKAIPYAALLHEELLNSTAKYVVMGIHVNALRSVRDFLVRRGIHCVSVQGDTPKNQVAGLVQAFQESPKVRVFIGNIRAAGTGLTLTASCNVDMLESDWTPAGNAQAIKRVHRIGQVQGVRARFITLANSIDEAVNRIVAEKTASIAAIEGEAMHSHPPVAA